MSNAVTVKPKNKRSLRRVAQILREFNAMDVTIDKVAPKSGDVLLFKVGGEAKLQGPMIEAFLQHLHDRGIKDCMAMVLDKEDSIETVSAERIGELALAAGYVKSESDLQTVSLYNRQKGRQDVLRLLEKIREEIVFANQPDSSLENINAVLGRIREAITKASGNGKEAPAPKPAEPERPVEIPYT